MASPLTVVSGRQGGATAAFLVPVVATLAEAFSPHTWDSVFIALSVGAVLLVIERAGDGCTRAPNADTAPVRFLFHLIVLFLGAAAASGTLCVHLSKRRRMAAALRKDEEGGPRCAGAPPPTSEPPTSEPPTQSASRELGSARCVALV